MEPDSSTSGFPVDPRHKGNSNMLFPDGHAVAARLHEIYPVYFIRPCYDVGSGKTVPTPRLKRRGGRDHFFRYFFK